MGIGEVITALSAMVFSAFVACKSITNDCEKCANKKEKDKFRHTYGERPTNIQIPKPPPPARRSGPAMCVGISGNCKCNDCSPIYRQHHK